MTTNAPATTPAPAPPDDIRVITPADRPAVRFPRWALPIPVAAALLSLLAEWSDVAPLQILLALALAASALAGCALAGWLVQRLTRALSRRSAPLQLLLTALALFFGPPLGLTASGLLEDLLGRVGIDGVAICTGLFGTLWFTGAVIGALSVNLIDVSVSAVASRFRTRIVLSVLSLLGMVSLVMIVLGRGAALLIEGLASKRDDVVVDIGAGPNAEAAQLVVDLVTNSPSAAYLVVLLLGILLLLPAVTSASNSLADAVMERIHPMLLAFDQVAAGARDVHLEEAGSADFIEVSQRFNAMVDQLRLGERLERSFGTYVSPQVLRRIKQQHGEAMIPPSVHQATVFFADIRGFTTLSEALTPAQVVELLNRYFTRVVEIISEHEGYLDKFIGDAVVVVFNGPIEQPDHALRATRCAVAMLDAVREMNQAGLFPEVEALRIGIGAATGDMLCGNVGSARQMEYTVIGDTVNLASRIEGMTKLYGASLIVSQETREQLGEQLASRRLDRVAAKGKLEPVVLYEVLDGLPDEEREAKLGRRQDYEAARALFERGELAAARAAFESCVAQNPADRAAQLGLERCVRLAEDGLPADWDGITRLTEK